MRISLVIIFILMQCSTISALNILTEKESAETGQIEEEDFVSETDFFVEDEPAPPEVAEAIMLEKKMRDEVIERKMEEKAEAEVEETVDYKPIKEIKVVSKGPPLSVIIILLAVLIISLVIYHGKSSDEKMTG